MGNRKSVSTKIYYDRWCCDKPPWLSTTTEDIDLWIEDTKANKEVLRNVFREYGMGDFKTLPDMQFIPGWTYFHLDNGLRLDIMTSVKGLENSNFDSLLKSASIATIYGVDIPFLNLN